MATNHGNFDLCGHRHRLDGNFVDDDVVRALQVQAPVLLAPQHAQQAAPLAASK